jgi:hypothetical protein
MAGVCADMLVLSDQIPAAILAGQHALLNMK